MRIEFKAWMLSAVAAVLYLPTIFSGWVYLDDYLFVQESDFYADIKHLVSAFTRSVWLPQNDQYMYYRPVSTGLYILDAWISTLISGEVKPWIYHLTNVILVCAVVALAYLVFKKLKCPAALAFALVLGFLAHPFSVPTVAWISGQNELLLGLFVLAAFYSLIRAMEIPKPGAWLAAFSFFFLGGLLTKENAMALIPLSLLFVLTNPERRKSISFWTSLSSAWAGALIVWILLLQQGAAPPALGNALNGMFYGFPYLSIFLGQLIFPIELNVLPIPLDTPLYIYAAGVIGGIVLLALGILHLRQKPMILFGLIWFIAFLLPTFSKMDPATADTFILRGDRSYLASLGIFLALTQWKWSKWWLIILPPLMALNLFHQLDYRDGLSFYTNASLKSPRLAFAHTHLADMYLLEKDLPKAAATYERALKLNDTELNAYNNLGVTYQRMGELNRALSLYQEELRRHPNNTLSLYNSGMILLNQGKLDEAEGYMRQMVVLNPAHQEAWAALMKIYSAQKKVDKYEEATKAFAESQRSLRQGI